MRERRELSQTELGDMLGMNQNAIYRLESPHYGKATLTTLKRVAAAFDVALIVRFVPFSQLVDWISGTPFVDRGLSSESLSVPSFEDENEVKLSTNVAKTSSVSPEKPSPGKVLAFQQQDADGSFHGREKTNTADAA